MAKVWCLVIVLIFVQNTLAYFCGENSKISTCDQCIRCGNKWCSKEKVDVRCSYADKDDWCSGEPESLFHIQAQSGGGTSIHPAYINRTLFINVDDAVPFTYNSDFERNVTVHIYKSSQNLEGVEISTTEVECSTGIKGSRKKCELNIAAKVTEDFCTATSTDMEFIYASVKVEGIPEEALIKYHVPCACECSKKTVRKAQQCSGNGDLTCGACYCYQGWKGARCDKSDCPDRGDVPTTCHELGCSGNGFCGPCGNCICYSDREGSQYFDPLNLCSDICMVTFEQESECGPCLTTAINGTCLALEKACPHRVKVDYNVNVTQLRDSYDRRIWVRCNGTFEIENAETHYMEYFAMMEEDTIRLMVIEETNSQGIFAGPDGAQTKVPLILGILGVVAAIAAVGGVLLWKHLQSAPPLPFASPDYQNIDAEDCVGENPLYKPPTSTFTNPQYGKC